LTFPSWTDGALGSDSATGVNGQALWDEVNVRSSGKAGARASIASELSDSGESSAEEAVEYLFTDIPGGGVEFSAEVREAAGQQSKGGTQNRVAGAKTQDLAKGQDAATVVTAGISTTDTPQHLGGYALPHSVSLSSATPTSQPGAAQVRTTLPPTMHPILLSFRHVVTRVIIGARDISLVGTGQSSSSSGAVFLGKV
jgi:hypothetical protein